MDPTQIVLCLQGTFSTVQQERSQAEVALGRFEETPGFCVALLKILASNEIDQSVRQAASIQLKSVCSKHWEPRPELQRYTLDATEKQFVKDNIVEVLIQAPSVVRNQLGEVIRNIADLDYPQNWPQLVPKILTYLGTKELHTVYGALEALRYTIKKYEYMTGAKGQRKPLNDLCSQTFPVLTQVFQGLLTSGGDSLESAHMILMLSKIFYSAINFGVPAYLMTESVFDTWMAMLLNVLERPVPVHGQPQDPEDRPQYPWWKCKKRASETFSKLFSRYGDPSAVEGKADKVFSKRFQSAYAPKLLHSFLAVLNQKRNGGYLPDRVAHSALQYILSAIRRPKVFSTLKPHIEEVYKDILFPFLCFNEADFRLWNEDPHEYLRREFDIINEFYSPKQSAIYICMDLCAIKNANYIHMIMSHIGNVLVRYQQAQTTEDKNRLIQEKEGAINLIGNLSTKLLRNEAYKSSVENMLAQHILPEFSNPHGFVRARACWVYSQFVHIQFQNKETFINGLRGTLNLLRDPELPVRVQASLAIRFLVVNDSAKEEIKPVLPTLLGEYFKLMNDIDNDELVNSLELIIESFQEEIGPHAVALAASLVEAFQRMYSNDEEDDSVVAAMEVLGALQTLMDAISEKKELFPQIEALLLPVFDKLLNPEGLEFFEECLKLITFITFFSPSISENMWHLFPRLISAFHEGGIDLITELLIPLDNYISRGTEAFLTLNNGQYPAVIFEMYKKVLSDPKCSEEHCVDAGKLMEVVLAFCKGRVDHLILPVIEIAVAKLQTVKRTFLKVQLLELIADALIYNPLLTLQILESKGWTQPVFSLWFSLVPKFSRPHDKKVCILGLSALLQVPFAQLPAIIQAGTKQIVETLIKLQVAMEKQMKDWEAEEERMRQEDEKLQQELDADEIDNEDDEVDDQTLEQLANEARAYLEEEDEDEDGGDDEHGEADDASDNEPLEEEGDFESPYDEIDSAAVIVDQLKGLVASNAAVFQPLLGQLDAETQQLLQQISVESEQRKLAKQQQQQ